MYLDLKEANHIENIVTRVTYLKRNQARIMVNSMLHYEIHHGIDYLMKNFKHLKRVFLDIDEACNKPHVSRARKAALLRSKTFRRRPKVVFTNTLAMIYIVQGLDKVLKILNLPGRWKAKPPGRKEFSKFRHSVSQKPSKVPIPLISKNLISSEEFDSSISVAKVSYSPLNAANTHVLEGKTARGPQHIAEEMYALTMAGEIYRRHEPYLASLFGLEPRARELLLENSKLYKLPIIGKIAGLTDDGGLKVRMIANLVKGWQVAISPLTSVLKAWLKVQPESSMFDQTGGALWMEEQLRNGKTVTSIDIVNSTDNLEKRVYEKVIEEIIAETFLKGEGITPAFVSFVGAYYLDKDLNQYGYYETPFDDIKVRYNKGQAMGRWTSKYLLDTTMILMFRSVGGNGGNGRINGDDIFITDNRVARRFKRLLNRMEIPISEPKSFFYKRFGEFSGRIINSTSGILPVFKGRRIDWVKDPFGSIRQYGYEGLQLIPKFIRKKVKVVAAALGERDVSEFLDKVENMHQGYTPECSTSIIERKSWDNLWVQQVFCEHAAKEVYEEAMSNFYDMDFTYADLSNDHSMYMWERFKQQSVKLSELRKHTIFKSVALQRFSEPNQRLDPFIDLLNSSFVHTSDGHYIRGYGGMNHVISRLRQAKCISSNKYDAEPTKEKLHKWNWVIKTYRSIIRWWKRPW